MSVKGIAVALGCFTLALACGDPNGPRSGLNILSGDQLSDTVGSLFRPSLAVRLLDGNLQPLANQTVYFNTNGVVLVAPINSPGSVINRLPVTTDANGDASVWVEAKFGAGSGKVVVVAPSGQSVETHYTVLPGAAARVRADPSDTVLYVGGSETFRPYITDAYGNRRPDMPTYQYQSLNGALAVSGAQKATGPTIGRGSVAITALGFTDTVWASVVPQGRVATQYVGRGDFGGPIIVINLDGSAFDTIPRSYPGGRSLDWSGVTHDFVLDRVGTGEYVLLMDTMGTSRRLVTDSLMRSQYHPQYSNDGSHVYFAGNDSVTTCYGIWRIHPNGTGLERVVADTSDCGVLAYQNDPVPNYASSPSPDGHRLVYVGHTLRIRTLATGADTSLGVVGDVPRWSPTGEWIAYDSLGTIMLIHPDGTGHQSLLDRGRVLVLRPVVGWSPDGQWLLYRNNDRLVLVQVATGLQLPLAFTVGLSDPIWQR